MSIKRHLNRRLAVGVLVVVVGLVSLLSVAPAGSATPSPAAVSRLATVATTTQIQYSLSGLGYLSRSGVDGSYGPATKAAAAHFQNDRCLDADGATGPITWGELSGRVKAVQAKVGVTADGIYGPGTLAEVKAWQAAHGLASDGIAGTNTMAAMSIQRVYPCGSPIVGNPYSSSTSVPCAAGTRFVADRSDGYVNGARISIKLCAIPGLKSSAEESKPGSLYYVTNANGDTLVNSRVSGAYYGLYLRSKRSGVALGVRSSFRTWAHQVALYNASGGDGSVARPGYSGHQSGNSVDFTTGGSFRGSATCSNRTTSTSAMYGFLVRNDQSQGLGQLATEPWHFQPLTASATCA